MTNNAKKPICFAIAPIGPKESDTRRRSDKVLKHIFKKALDEKYEVIRGDDIDEPGMITSQVLQVVQDSPLVVADLTGHNPNVLYELAVRHAVEKPVIHVIEPKISKIPFDIAGFRTIEFDLTDPDSIEIAVEKLKKYAEQTEKGHWGETPIKLANIMRRSNEDSPQILLLKEAVEGIAAIRTTLNETIRLGQAFSEEDIKTLDELFPETMRRKAGEELKRREELRRKVEEEVNRKFQAEFAEEDMKRPEHRKNPKSDKA